MFIGACGDFSLEGLPSVGAVAGVAWFGYFTSSKNDLRSMAVRVVAVIAASMWFLTAIVDVLWGGHEPVF
jgi:hypothetical protein